MPLHSGYYLEGLAVGGDAAWVSDVIGGGIVRLAGDLPRATFLAGERWIGGVLLQSDGTLLSSGRGGIRRTDPATGESRWLVSEIDDKPINGVNEMAADGRGGLFFGTVDLERIIAGQRTGPVALCHLDAGGHARIVCDGLVFTNGIALSPDGSTLYCNESFDGTYAYDITADHNLSRRRLVCKKPDCDGLALDHNGVLWITGFSSGHIERIAPDGAPLEHFQTPAEAVTQIRFGGADMRDLYLATVPIDAGAGLAKGRLPASKRSHLLRTRSDAPGLVLRDIAL